MAGLLSGGIAGAFAQAFGAFYLDGTLIRVTKARGAGGDLTSTTTEDQIKGQVDACTEAMRREEGFTDRDVRLIVLQVGPSGAITRPNTDCKVSLGGDTSAIQSVGSDPANSYWEMRGRPA